LHQTNEVLKCLIRTRIPNRAKAIRSKASRINSLGSRILDSKAAGRSLVSSSRTIGPDRAARSRAARGKPNKL
jgi:hypothetical protein